MNNQMLSRLSHPFAIDLEMLAVFRWLLAAIVIWGLVGRVQIRDYVFSIPPAAAVETAPWPVKAPADAPALAPSRDSTAAEPTTVRTVLLTSDESRSVWTPWHWSVLWLDQVIARIRTTLMSVEPVRRAEDLAGPAGPGERVERGEPTVTPPVYFAWNDALARWQAFFASQWWFDGVLGLGIASGILFGVGLFTKTANLILWVVVVSLQHRLPLFNSGADSLERLFLFWLLFLPSGAVGSLDAIWFPRQGFWRKRIHQSRWQCDLTLADSPPGPSSLSRHTICSWASAALLIQLVAIYLYSALEKLNADWWQGTAVASALQWDFIAKPLATTWLEFPGFLRCVTWTVLLLELLCPILIFTPYVFGWTRRLTAYFFIAMHLAIAATLSIGTFSAVCLVGWLLFFPWPNGWRVSWTSLCRDPRDTGAPLPQQIPASTRAAATAGECLVILLLTLTVWWNLAHASVLRPWLSFPVQLQPIVCQFGLDPNFPMFGQVPSHNYAWQHRVEFTSGRSRNIRPDLPPPLNVPNRISSWAESHGVFLWRQLHVNLLYLESQQPDFVWQVRDQLRTLELEIWHEQQRQTSTPLAEPFESLHSELLLIDQVTQDEQSWSMTDF